MNLKQASISSLLIGLLLPIAYAEQVDVVGSIPKTIQQSNPNTLMQKDAPDAAENNKIIQLMKVALSDEKKLQLAEQAKDAAAHTHQFALMNPSANYLPETVQLGMSNVPVLDQGSHGSCVTFAVTGGLDAAVGKGDYISQVCNLQLGSYFERMRQGNSGWNGATGTELVRQIQQYGVVNVQNQRARGCGGLTEYPTNSKHSADSFMYPSEFVGMSEFILGTVANVFDVDFGQSGDALLRDTKEALNAGDRLVFATLLPRHDLGTVGAVAKHNTWFVQDTWVLTPEIIGGVKDVDAAHEMIIVGYDDNAVAVDSHGEKHKGLLVLRNSWGSWVGYWGEFYMSYDYFKLLGYDVKRISKVSA